MSGLKGFVNPFFILALAPAPRQESRLSMDGPDIFISPPVTVEEERIIP